MQVVDSNPACGVEEPAAHGSVTGMDAGHGTYGCLFPDDVIVPECHRGDPEGERFYREVLAAVWNAKLNGIPPASVVTGLVVCRVQEQASQRPVV